MSEIVLGNGIGDSRNVWDILRGDPIQEVLGVEYDDDDARYCWIAVRTQDNQCYSILWFAPPSPPRDLTWKAVFDHCMFVIFGRYGM